MSLQPGWSRWTPGECDPTTMSTEDLRFRARLLHAMDQAAERSGTPGSLELVPVEACDFICWLCRRVFRREWTNAEAAAEFRDKYPGEEMDDERDFCGDCVAVMETWDAEPEEGG